jgi:hypothetical protein
MYRLHEPTGYASRVKCSHECQEKKTNELMFIGVDVGKGVFHLVE